MENQDSAALIRGSKIIAVVGLSANPVRPSYEVAQYLQRHAYRIVPVNPAEAGNYILGECCYASLAAAVQALAQTGEHIDLLDCFRRAEFMPELVEEAIALGIPAIWMQLGVQHAPAAARARAAGMQVVMNRCLKIEHATLGKP
jgi:predicted CoA-binding protein